MRSGFNQQPARAQSVFRKNFSWGKSPTVNPVITSCAFPVYLLAMKTTHNEKGLTFGELRATAYNACARGKARGILRLALQAYFVVFRWRNRYEIS